MKHTYIHMYIYEVEMSKRLADVETVETVETKLVEVRVSSYIKIIHTYLHTHTHTYIYEV